MAHFKRANALEVIVTNAEEAQIAQNAGADRVELIRDFAVGGLTPDIATVKAVLMAVSIPIRVMIRQTADFSQNDSSQLQTMREFLKRISELQIDGIVLGFVANNKIDQQGLKNLLDNFPELNVTFHRAFEATQDPVESISVLKRFSQIDKILTNGGSSSWGSSAWQDRIQRLQIWQNAAEPIKILVGGEVDADALLKLRDSSLTEFHVGRSVRTPETTDGQLDATKIQTMSRILRFH